MKGKTAIFKSLNIEANEITPVLLLITQSVFLGIFYGTFDIGAHTLFLKTYPEEMIPKAYVLSGVVGIMLTTTYSKLQSKLKFSNLATYTLLFIAVCTILLRGFFEITTANWTVFVVFLLFGPLNILAFYLAFWGTVSRIFNLRQGKRLFGIIDTGQVFGIIISSYAIPFILTYLNGTKNLLLLSAISIVFAVIIELIIAKKYNLDTTETEEEAKQESTEETTSGVKIMHFFKDRYILYMALFVIFSMFAAFFVQYSFLVVTNEQYPVEEELAKYLAFFTGSMMVFTLIIKTFVYSKLMKTYGLKVSLILSPLLLALFTGIAIIVGWFSGYEAGSSGFIYFFLFISLGKLFNKTLKDALEVPAFKLLYQSLKKSIRFDVQAKIDGTINEIAALTSGILLSVLGILAFIKLIHFSIFLFALLGIWTFITIKLYKEYRNSLEKSLSEDKTDSEDKISENTQISFNDLTDERIIKKFNLIYKYQPQIYLDQLIALSKQQNNLNVDKLPTNYFIELYQHHLLENGDFTSDFDTFKNRNSDKIYSTPIISELLNSSKNSDIAEAINHIYNLDTKSRLTLLWALLRVPNVTTQNYTMRICGYLQESETINTLIEFLDSESLFSSALISLRQLAKKSPEQIIQMFYKSDISLTAQLSIIDIVSEADINKTLDFLIENLSSNRKEIFEKSICLLKTKEIEFEEDSLPKLFHPITIAAKTLSWDIAAIASLSSQKQGSALMFALENEFEKHKAILMDLLAITYDKTSVSHVQDHLNSGTSEGIGYALELFDLFLSEEIKPMILAVFEDMSLIEKSRILEAFFPVEVSSEKQLIVDIINRDPNLISNETKKIALTEYLNYYNEVSNDIIAHLFNPVQPIQKSAAKVINSINPNLLTKLKIRLQPKQRYTINQWINENENQVNVLDLLNQNPEFVDKFKIDDNSIVEISNFLYIENNIKLNFLNNNEIVNNYFVFLKANQINSTEVTNEVKLHFESFIIKDELSFNDNDFIIGIKKDKMNRLTLTQSKFIENLINTL